MIRLMSVVTLLAVLVGLMGLLPSESFASHKLSSGELCSISVSPGLAPRFILCKVTQVRNRKTIFERIVVPASKPSIVREEEAKVRTFQEISTVFEGGRLEVDEADATTLEGKASYERTWNSRFDLGANLSYLRADFDDPLDLTSDSFQGNLYSRLKFFNAAVKVGALLNYSHASFDVSGEDFDEDAYGFGVFTSLHGEIGPVLFNGGVIYQYTANKGTGRADPQTNSVSVGAGIGIPVGSQWIINTEAFHIKFFDFFGTRDNPWIVGTSVTFFASKFWGLTLGWKTILNIPDFSSHEGTLGASVRF